MENRRKAMLQGHMSERESPYDRPTALLRQHRAVKAAVLP